MKKLSGLLSGLLAIMFLGAGAIKMITPYEKMIADPNLGWTNDFSHSTILIIAGLEILGALGLVLPSFLKKFRFLTPISSICLGATMIGAAFVHIEREEEIIPNLVLFGFAMVVTYLNKDYLSKSKN